MYTAFNIRSSAYPDTQLYLSQALGAVKPTGILRHSEVKWQSEIDLDQ